MATLRGLTCPVLTDETIKRSYPKAYASHVAHAFDFTECDAIRCACGNEPHFDGFHPCFADGRVVAQTENGVWEREGYLIACGRCSRVIDRYGYQLARARHERLRQIDLIQSVADP